MVDHVGGVEYDGGDEYVLNVVVRNIHHRSFRGIGEHQDSIGQESQADSDKYQDSGRRNVLYQMPK